MTTILSIAASDGCGGAGIQRDNTTINALGGYPLNVVTAITTQDHLAVHNSHCLPAKLVCEQLNTLLARYPIDAIKIGVLADSLIQPIAQALRQQSCAIVLDPVIRSTSGFTFIHDVDAFAETLLPLATHMTPNAYEAHQLSGLSGTDKTTDTCQLAHALRKRGAHNIIVTNADQHETFVTDTLFAVDDTAPQVLQRDKIKVANSHGTGCAFSSALAFYLAQGLSLQVCHRRAVDWVESTLREEDESSVTRSLVST
ncbi:MAG: hydroxymethylpyrimidine/phosphomethylpyrimidine kinase [Alphaproteobacteria bacterium GM202ARS2]|nr:hydroxymethylpyrimidine/phosphomethylpyrimidine kinase [Alphaproteobacteria bacterium GM202ARS2]